MKSMNCFIPVSCLILSFTGCVKMANDSDERRRMEEVNQQVRAQNERILRDAQASALPLDSLIKNTKAGGSPASITLRGAATTSKLIATKTLVGTSCGKDSSGASEQVDAAAVALIETPSETISFAEKTYINLGCDVTKLPEGTLKNYKNVAEHDGYVTESEGAKEPSIIHLKASQVFICGEMEYGTAISHTVTAEQLFLSNVSVNWSNPLATIQLNANQLTLAGDNALKMSESAKATPALVPTSQSMKISVNEKIDGDGTLALDTRGADCLDN